MIYILITAVFALLIAFILGAALGFFRDFFAVPQNPMQEQIRSVLPGANCGACGYPGCDAYATAIVSGTAGINSCLPGGASLREKLSEITGKTGEPVQALVSVLACQGSWLHAPQKGVYTGIQSCRGAKIAVGSTKLCIYGCMGFGDCLKACKFDAISLDKEKGLPVVDIKKCTGCRLCINECPQKLLKGIGANLKGAFALCSNVSTEKQGILKTCKTACIKCGICVKTCPLQCIGLINGIPVVDYSKCNSCGSCNEKCPTKVLTIL
ncbi:MAG: RnfABCDGE type electron transport complex subunit B [Treponema sp.]|nr:RnfABCDGE type electron transport complex subunit B [Treponema sp.]